MGKEGFILSREFLRFVIVGVMNTGVYYAIYFSLLQFSGFHYLISHAVGVLLSMVFSYFLNVYFTYNVKPSWKTFFLFPVTQAVNIIVTVVVLWFLVDVFRFSAIYAPFMALVLTVPITFLVTGRVLKQNESAV